MQEIIYVVHIENGIVLDEVFLETLDQMVEGIAGCKVIRSKVEDDEVVVENGEWEDEEDE